MSHIGYSQAYLTYWDNVYTVLFNNYYQKFNELNKITENDVFWNIIPPTV